MEGVGPENHIKLATCSTEYRIQKTAAANLMYIPMYLFFNMALGLNDYDGGNPLLGPLEGICPHQNCKIQRHIKNRYMNSY